MRPWKAFEWIARHGSALQVTVAIASVLLVAGVALLVYQTGGIKYVFSHSMYLPVMLAALVFGVKGGLLLGLLGGLALGPYMPIDTASGEMQNTVNWLYRTGFFILIGSFVGLASDAMRRYTRHLAWIATHDEETGLPNRLALERALDGPDLPAPAGGHRHFVLLLTLLNSKEIEVTFGLAAVHQVIVQLAARIRAHTPETDTVYRIHTGQLGLLLRELTEDRLEALGGALYAEAEAPFHYGELDLHGDIYLGAAEFTPFAEPPAYCLTKAAGAVNVAIDGDVRGVVLAAPEVDAEYQNNLALLGKLKHAIEQHELSIHYQPKISLDGGRVHGVEALMRWRHPELGDIPPGRFIPRAEKSTLIDALTDFALAQALGQHAEWRRHGIEGISTAVNVSTRNLVHPAFADQVLRMLDEYGIARELLELEVTESSFIANFKSAMRVLSELASVHVVISIDDFGTGYSSLQYLEKLPVSTIKIDQSFIRSLPDNSHTRSIVEAAVDLAHRLGMTVVAEGVETRDAYRFLGEIGCDVVQGFYISRALPNGEFIDWYRGCNGTFTG